jgi:hypothetical protein
MQRKQKPNNNTSSMATTLASNYWTATAHHVMQVPPSQEDCDCDSKLKPKRKCMRCNSEVKGEEGIVLSIWDFRTRALIVLQCSRCT